MNSHIQLQCLEIDNHMLNEMSDYIHGFMVVDVKSYDENTGQHFGYIESLGEGHWEYFTLESYRNKHTPLNI